MRKQIHLSLNTDCPDHATIWDAVKGSYNKAEALRQLVIRGIQAGPQAQETKEAPKAAPKPKRKDLGA